MITLDEIKTMRLETATMAAQLAGITRQLAEVIAELEGTPAPPPVDPIPAPDPDQNPVPVPTDGVFLRRAGFWSEGGFPALAADPGPSNWMTRGGPHSKGRGLFFRVPPWANEGVWSDSLIASWCQATKMTGCRGVIIDVENVFWYSSGYLARWVKHVHAEGLVCGAAVKASLAELSGNHHVDVPRGGVAAHIAYYRGIGIDCYVPWAYGSYQSHVAAWTSLTKAGISTGNILLLHDSFRQNDQGYNGKGEWPKLVAWAKQDPANRLIGAFQEQSNWGGAAASRKVIAELDGMYPA